MQKFVQGLLVALAVLFGGFQAEAFTIAMTPDGFVDLSRFYELEKAAIIRTAENMVVDSITELPDDLFAGKDGSLKFKKLFAFSFTMLAAEANRVGLEPLAKLNGFKTMNFQDNIRGTTDFEKMKLYDEKIETEKQKYFDSVLDRHADKQGMILSEDIIEEHARVIAQDILAIAKEKVFGRK